MYDHRDGSPFSVVVHVSASEPARAGLEVADGAGWNFVPYVAALLFTLLAAGLAAMAIKRPFRAEEKA